jgi:hypothetical protein
MCVLKRLVTAPAGYDGSAGINDDAGKAQADSLKLITTLKKVHLGIDFGGTGTEAMAKCSDQ